MVKKCLPFGKYYSRLWNRDLYLGTTGPQDYHLNSINHMISDDTLSIRCETNITYIWKGYFLSTMRYAMLRKLILNFYTYLQFYGLSMSIVVT